MPAFAAAENFLEILVAVGVGVAEVVRFIDDDDSLQRRDCL